MSAIKKFLSDTVIYGVTTIVSRMIGFLMTPLYLRKFKDAAVYGIYSNFYAWMSMLNAVLAFGMETTYFRYLQKVEPQDKNKVYNNSFFVTLVSSGILLLSVFVFTRPIAAWFADGADVDLYEQYIKYFAFILVADALAVVPFTKLRAEGRPYKYSALKFVNIGITVISNLFFIYFLPDWVHQYSFWADFAGTWFKEGWIGYVFISNLFASVVTLILLLPELMTFRLKLDRKLMNQMLKYSFPILIANISFIINENLDKMFFPKLLPGEVGIRDLGIYGAVAKLAVFLSLFVTAFRLGAEPFFFSYSKNQNASKTYALIMEYFVILMVIAMVGLTVNLDWLKYFIKGNEKEIAIYWTGLKIVPILLFNYVLLGIYMNLSIWYKLTDQTRYALYISGIGALITILLNVWLIPTYSYVGAVLSTTVVYLVMIGFSLYWGQMYYPIPYKMIKISTYLGVGLLISWLSFQVFHSNIWIGNAMLLTLLGVTFFLEKKELMKLIRRN
ncbi:MAG: oligosaccharide flippase family protein [Sphingobacterium sp.]|uniref:lipopolysaccharide biosynthesis protein n=1 Tax=unclassified Sphingobacterium TaxID=2609468 RepID=UPI0020C93CE4|nr:polysaccharide biosynthesis C-terminal domain-containing protein [Sphingobacterium sp. CZ-UAM]MDF2518228.1 oligosaccharide flippase family protein [Sphingobacterium sp.]